MSELLANTRPPVLHGSRDISLLNALELVEARSGLILSREKRVSLPFTIEIDNSRLWLRSHIPNFMEEIVEDLSAKERFEVIFDTAGYYIDPSWILRESAHAPTEVKAVFSIKGAGSLVSCTDQEAISHLDQVRAAKQRVYLPGSNFKVSHLPDDYLKENLALISHFRIEISELYVHQCMALKHLDASHRRHIIEQLGAAGGRDAEEAARIIQFSLEQ